MKFLNLVEADRARVEGLEMKDKVGGIFGYQKRFRVFRKALAESGGVGDRAPGRKP